MKQKQYCNSIHFKNQFSSVQLLSPLWLFATPWAIAHQSSLSITNSWSLFKPVHRVGDTIQPSHSLSPPSPPTFKLSQHQGLFQWISSSHRWPKYGASAAVLPINIQDWFPLGLTGWMSLQSKGLSRVFSNTTVQKHQFFRVQLSL